MLLAYKFNSYFHYFTILIVLVLFSVAFPVIYWFCLNVASLTCTSSDIRIVSSPFASISCNLISASDWSVLFVSMRLAIFSMSRQNSANYLSRIWFTVLSGIHNSSAIVLHCALEFIFGYIILDFVSMYGFFPLIDKYLSHKSCRFLGLSLVC